MPIYSHTWVTFNGMVWVWTKHTYMTEVGILHLCWNNQIYYTRKKIYKKNLIQHHNENVYGV